MVNKLIIRSTLYLEIMTYLAIQYYFVKKKKFIYFTFSIFPLIFLYRALFLKKIKTVYI